MELTSGIIADTTLIAAIEQAADCIVITNRAGIIEYVNPAYTLMTGYSCAEAVGQSTRIHKSGVHSANLYRELWETICSGRKWQGELTNCRKDGTLYRDEMQITPVRGPDGEISHFIAIKKDVSARREEEEAVRNSLESAQSTIDSILSNICVLDEFGVIIAVNQAWREFAHANMPDSAAYSDGELPCLGVRYLEVCDHVSGEEAEDAQKFAAGIRAVLSGESDHYSAEYPCDSPAERRWFLGRVTRFRNKNPTRVLVEHINITERKLAEESLLFKSKRPSNAPFYC